MLAILAMLAIVTPLVAMLVVGAILDHNDQTYERVRRLFEPYSDYEDHLNR